MSRDEIINLMNRGARLKKTIKAQREFNCWLLLDGNKINIDNQTALSILGEGCVKVVTDENEGFGVLTFALAGDCDE